MHPKIIFTKNGKEEVVEEKQKEQKGLPSDIKFFSRLNCFLSDFDGLFRGTTCFFKIEKLSFYFIAPLP